MPFLNQSQHRVETHPLGDIDHVAINAIDFIVSDHNAISFSLSNNIHLH